MKNLLRKNLARLVVAICAPIALFLGLLSTPAGSVRATTAPPTATTAAPPPTPTTAPPTPAPTPPPTPPPTTVPYYKIVEGDCVDFEGNEALAEKLEEAKKDSGSTHLVSMARYCGVLFADEAIQDPELDRPRSNLEYAVYEGDDPFFSKTWDDVTANAAQKLIVIEASTEAWYVLNPTTTVAPTTENAAVTTEPSEASTTVEPTDGSTTEPSATTEVGDEIAEGDTDGGSDTVQILGLLLLGAAAVFWGVYGVINDPDEERAVRDAE